MTWKKTKISELAKGIRGVTFSSNNLNDEVGESNFFLLRSNNIQKSNLTLKDVLIVDGQCVSEKQSLKNGDILVCMSNGSRILVGKNAIFNLSDLNYCVGAFCSSFRPYENSVPDFVFQLFQSDDYKRKIDVILAGSAINNLTNNQIEEFEFLLPTSTIEQKRIAEILSTADEAIEQTQSLIDKYNRIKRGLMQDLLTRGIDENGNIRSKQTHKFTVKNGIEVPDDWEVQTLQQLAGNDNPICYGIVQVGSQTESGVPTVAIKDMKKSYEALHLTDPEIERMYKRSRIQGGDLLISVKGTTGRVDVTPANFIGNISRDIAKIRLRADANPQYFAYYFESLIGQRRLDSIIVGSTRKEISIQPLKELYVPCPSLNEQSRIVACIQEISSSIQNQISNIRKLESIKKGLMQDLLSGKVRVM